MKPFQLEGYKISGCQIGGLAVTNEAPFREYFDSGTCFICHADKGGTKKEGAPTYEVLLGYRGGLLTAMNGTALRFFLTGKCLRKGIGE